MVMLLDRRFGIRMCSRNADKWMKSPAFAHGVFAPGAPADLVEARQDIGDRLLLSMMVDPGTGSWLDLEQPTPQCRLNAALRCDRSSVQRAWRLCPSRAELRRTDNADGRTLVHRLTLVSGTAMRLPNLAAVATCCGHFRPCSQDALTGLVGTARRDAC